MYVIAHLALAGVLVVVLPKSRSVPSIALRCSVVVSAVAATFFSEHVVVLFLYASLIGALLLLSPIGAAVMGILLVGGLAGLLRSHGQRRRDDDLAASFAQSPEWARLSSTDPWGQWRTRQDT